MRIRPQDWRVTASLEADRCVGHFAEVRDAALDTRVEVLQHYWSAYCAAGAAVGALVHAEIGDNVSWPELPNA